MEIARHPEVSLGRAERISGAESLACFLSRPVGSRLGAWVLQQSAVIGSRSILEAQWEAMKHRSADGEVPLPPAWGLPVVQDPVSQQAVLASLRGSLPTRRPAGIGRCSHHRRRRPHRSALHPSPIPAAWLLVKV